MRFGAVTVHKSALLALSFNVLECSYWISGEGIRLPLLQHLEKALPPYTGKVEEFSCDSVAFLDMRMSMVRCGGLSRILI